jgi:hypothetical protein
MSSLPFPLFTSTPHPCTHPPTHPTHTPIHTNKRRVVFVETYELADRSALQTYFDKYAQPVRDDHTRMWDGKFAARRRILHVFGRQSEQVGWGGPHLLCVCVFVCVYVCVCDVSMGR